MNIQIYGTAKCFDTKKAQRYFKERAIRFQFVDLSRFSLSRGELASVKKAVGGSLDSLINEKSKKYDSSFIKYLATEEAKEEKLLENGELFRTPIVRNGKKATVGYCPDVWKKWEEEEK